MLKFQPGLEMRLRLFLTGQKARPQNSSYKFLPSDQRIGFRSCSPDLGGSNLDFHWGFAQLKTSSPMAPEDLLLKQPCISISEEGMAG